MELVVEVERTINDLTTPSGLGNRRVSPIPWLIVAPTHLVALHRERICVVTPRSCTHPWKDGAGKVRLVLSFARGHTFCSARLAIAIVRHCVVKSSQGWAIHTIAPCINRHVVPIALRRWCIRRARWTNCNASVRHRLALDVAIEIVDRGPCGRIYTTLVEVNKRGVCRVVVCPPPTTLVLAEP